MGRNYEIPPDTNEEEKAIGGVLTFVQFFWLLGGAVLGVFAYMLIYLVVRIQVLAIIPAVAVALSGVPFAFIRKHDMPLCTYLMTKRKFDKKNKKLINRRNF